MIQVLFIVNPISGTKNKKRIVDLIPSYMDASQYSYEIRYTEYRGHAAEMAADAAKRGIDVVVAVGGDGTVNEVAGGLVHTQTALGVIPCGSGNGLARHLHIPMSAKGALEVLAECQIHEMDYGRINGQAFFCTCGVGFDAFVSDRFAKSGRRGLLTYIRTTLREGLHYEPEVYEIEADGVRQSYKAFLIACANASQYGNDAYIAPHASMNDGVMDVTVIEPFGLIGAATVAFQMFSKHLDVNKHVHSFQCKELKIHRVQPGVIHFDGDPQDADALVNVNIVPSGIRMVYNAKVKENL